jgi:hypothetical protein
MEELHIDLSRFAREVIATVAADVPRRAEYLEYRTR